jgi:hypothetical protein
MPRAVSLESGGLKVVILSEAKGSQLQKSAQTGTVEVIRFAQDENFTGCRERRLAARFVDSA